MTDSANPSAALETAPVVEPVTLANSDLPAYQAFREGAAIFNLAPRHISQFSGPGAAGALNGLITNDVTTLAVGRGLYAAALTPKGKMLADLAVLRIEPETFLVETSPAAGAEWFGMVRKYVNPRLAKYSDQSAMFAPIGVYGPRAAALLAQLGGATGGGAVLRDALTDALTAWPDWASATWNIPDAGTRLVRAPYLGTTAGFMLLADAGAAEGLRAQLIGMGAVLGSNSVWAMAALESGRPVFGMDMDATTIPQEANLEEWAAVSFEKGCYTGQETVARIHFRGHVNRHLRGLRSATPLGVGVTLFDESGKSVGDVRRSGVSPSLGPVAIAMIRREVPAGATVRAGTADGITATVTGLPFEQTGKLAG